VNANVATFIAFLTDAFQNLSYSQGSYSGSQHEESIRKLLIQYGFKEFNKGMITGYKNVRAALPAGHFVCQPAGSNGNPDFLVRFSDGTYQDLEAKSTKGDKPMYNGVPPKAGCIYILTSEKYNQTAIFHADDVMASRKLWEDYVKELRTIDSKYNALQSDWTGYSRQMFADKSTKHFDAMVRADLFQKTLDRLTVTVGPATTGNATVIPLGSNITLAAPTLSEIKNA
jgi:hypothetical protein